MTPLLCSAGLGAASEGNDENLGIEEELEARRRRSAGPKTSPKPGPRPKSPSGDEEDQSSSGMGALIESAPVLAKVGRYRYEIRVRFVTKCDAVLLTIGGVGWGGVHRCGTVLGLFLTWKARAESCQGVRPERTSPITRSLKNVPLRVAPDGSVRRKDRP